MYLAIWNKKMNEIIHKFISYLTGNTTPIHFEGNSANNSFRKVIVKNCALLLYYAASNDNSLPTLRDNLRSHIQIILAIDQFSSQILVL